MTNDEKKIIEAMKKRGTYHDDYLPTISRLASMRKQYAVRLKQQEKLLKEQPELLSDFHKPAVVGIVEGLRRDIIVYERELGLTTTALKKIGIDPVLKSVKRSALAEALADLGGGG